MMFACLFTVTALFAQMNVTLTFSTDGGKTWSEDFPVLADGKREFLVKAAWKVISEKPLKIVTTRLACRERDFASANMGRRNNYGKMNLNAWWQSLAKYWANPMSPTPFVYRVDLGERKAGIIGMQNEWSREQIDAPIVIRLKDIPVDFRVRSAFVKDGGQEIPSQLDDLDGDLKADELAFVLDMPAQSSRKVDVILSTKEGEKSYKPRVFATLLTRDAKNNRHAPVQSITVPGTTNYYNMVYGHGPMLESELVGYRIYFNEKQTIDPYGKFNKGLELKESRFYPNDEQLARGFGDDVLMVGNSCGVGALKGWDGQKATHIKPVAFRTEAVLAYGPIRAIAEVKVKGWKYQGSELTMTQRYILYIGGETVSYSDHSGLVGSWGRHWPVTDTVKYAKETIGLATYIPWKYVLKEVADKDNFLYTVSYPGQKSFHYYTMFTSRKETFGYPDVQTWFDHIKVWKDQLEHPLKVTVVR